MSALYGWTVTFLTVVTGVVAAHHLGYDLTAPVVSLLRQAEHFLGQPLLPP